MEFVKWWWGKRDGPERALLALFADVIISVISIPFLGELSLTLCAVLLLVTILFVLIYFCINGIRSEIKRFKTEKEQEADNIVKKLQGRFFNEEKELSGVAASAAQVSRSAARVLAQLKTRVKP